MPRDMVTPDPDAGFEDFGFGYYLPGAFTATFHRDLAIEIRAVLEDGRYIAEAVTAKRRRKGEAVTLERLRDTPIGSLISEAALTVVRRIETRGPGVEITKRGWDAIAQPSWSVDNHLGHVAAVYRLAHACGRPPTLAVKEALGTSKATAGRWIAAAREAKELGPAIERRAGEQKRKRRR